MLKLPKNVEYLLKKLNENNYEAYIVGGCVRDSLIGLEPHDWDICTSALPNQILEVFSDFKIIPTGLKHGTVTICIEDEQYEITTYRIDGEYEDNRHPKKVAFVNNLIEDLKRRDFTINSMAYNPNTGLIDFFNGKEDIKNKIIRCVGNANDRFNEDALRILRAIRFSITLKYDIELETLLSIYENKQLLKNISIERITSELTKILSCGYSILLGLIIRVIVPELTYKMIEYANIQNDMSLNAKLVNLFNLDNVYDILKRLKFDNKTIKNVCNIRQMIKFVQEEKERLGPRSLNKYIMYYNEDIIEDVICCLKYKDKKLATEMSKCLNKCKKECYKVSHLKINGNDLINLGYQGKAIGKLLNYLLFEVIEDKLKNNRKDLLKRIGAI